MKYVGVRKKLDGGAITLPKDVRNIVRLKKGDHVEIKKDGDTIRVKKIASTCELCAKKKHLVKFKTRLICEKCIDEIKAI